jgi:hypothetical protein
VEAFRFVDNGKFVEDLTGGKADGDVVAVTTNINADTQFKRKIHFHGGSFAGEMFIPESRLLTEPLQAPSRSTFEDDAGDGGGISGFSESE